MRTLFDPCGVWQVVQSILPSRTGMWPDFLTFIASCLWQVSQVSTAVTVFSCARSDFGLCTLWQVAHETLRASCMPPCQSRATLLLWQVRQVALTSLRRQRREPLDSWSCRRCRRAPGRDRDRSRSSGSACAAGVRVFCALPCSVACSALPFAFVAGGAGVVADEAAGGLRRRCRVAQRAGGVDWRSASGSGLRVDRRPLPARSPAPQTITSAVTSRLAG